MNKHTPGKWVAYEFGCDWYVGSPEYDAGAIVAMVGDYPCREANARLISAAPAMYEALKEIASQVTVEADNLYDTAKQYEDQAKTRVRIARAILSQIDGGTP